MDRPDERSVMTYVAQFVYKYPEVRSYSGETLSVIQQEFNDFVTWLKNRTKYLSAPQNITNSFEVSIVKHSDDEVLRICGSYESRFLMLGLQRYLPRTGAKSSVIRETQKSGHISWSHQYQSGIMAPGGTLMENIRDTGNVVELQTIDALRLRVLRVHSCL